jgi:hypothetical protein
MVDFGDRKLANVLIQEPFHSSLGNASGFDQQQRTASLIWSVQKWARVGKAMAAERGLTFKAGQYVSGTLVGSTTQLAAAASP